MLYLNQLNFRHVPYYHNTENGGPVEGRNNVATSGCGLCCACMLVDHLTSHSLTIEECVKLSEENGANYCPGVDLKMLGKVISEKFGLELTYTNDKEELLQHLAFGGEAVVNVSGDKEGQLGLFTKRRHYMMVIAVENDTVCLLDPNYSVEKYDNDIAREKVCIEEPFIYCSLDTLLKEAADCNPGFYLFKIKRNSL